MVRCSDVLEGILPPFSREDELVQVGAEEVRRKKTYRVVECYIYM
jgi:hypothetical protein